MSNSGTFLAQQINLFWLAVSFFTRIPVPQSMEYSPVLLNQSNRYFSLVGIILGLLLVLVYSLVGQVFSQAISVLFVMILSLLLTGAFHEDGLADMADGMGGGFTSDRRLEIMKDSRIGTYGTVSLLSVLGLKFSLLLELAQLDLFVMGLIASYALSRAVAGSIIFNTPYVVERDQSKSKPLAEQQSGKELLLLLLLGVAPLLWFSLSIVIMTLALLLVFRCVFRRWLMVRIGGFSGDCLGACQQIAELLIYLVIVGMSV